MDSGYPARKTFDHSEVNTWLEWFGLDDTDYPQAHMLNEEVIGPYLDQIIEEFHWHLSQNKQFVRAIGAIDQADLKVNLATSLLSLGQNFDTPEYFNERLRLGTLFSAAGVPLRFYPSTYTLIQQCILHHVPYHLQDWNNGGPLVCFVMKIMGLSLSLAIEAYHLSKMRDVEQSVAQLRLDVQRIAAPGDAVGTNEHHKAMGNYASVTPAGALLSQIAGPFVPDHG